jgi:putative oxidoreductase
MRHLLNTIISWFQLPAAIAEQAAMLLTRLALGQVFILTGWGKLHDIAGTAKNFEKWGFPAPELHATMAGTVELVGGCLLVLGLFTRVGAVMLATTMLVALVKVHWGQVSAALALNPDEDITTITAFVYLVMLLWLFARGGGVVSLDRPLLAWWTRTQVPSAPSAPPADAAT